MHGETKMSDRKICWNCHDTENLLECGGCMRARYCAWETRGILRGETEEEEVSLRDVDYGLYYLLIERFLIIYIQIVHNIHKIETI